MGSYKLGVVDANRLRRELFCRFLRTCDGQCRIVHETAVLEEGELSRFSAAGAEILVLWLDGHAAKAISFLRAARIQLPHARFLAVAHGQIGFALAGQIARSGLHGLVAHDASCEELYRALQVVCAGQLHFSEAFLVQTGRAALTRRGADEPAACAALSPRETEVLALLGRHLTDSAVAAMLHISPKTVSTHVSRIREKLNLLSRPELIRFAIEKYS